MWPSPLRSRGSRWRGLALIISSPACDGSVSLHSACMVSPPGANGGKFTLGRGGFAFIIISPACDGSVNLHSACMVSPGTAEVNAPSGGEVSPLQSVAPTGDRSVDTHAASMFLPGADGGKFGYRYPAISATRSHRRSHRNLIPFAFRQGQFEDIFIDAPNLNHAS